MRRFTPLWPHTLPFPRRLTRTPTWIVPLQPWLETALAGMKAVLVRAQK